MPLHLYCRQLYTALKAATDVDVITKAKPFIDDGQNAYTLYSSVIYITQRFKQSRVTVTFWKVARKLCFGWRCIRQQYVALI